MSRMKFLGAAGVMALLLSLPITPATAQGTGSVFKDCADCAEMVVIPAGKFLMGSETFFGHPAESDEKPQHPVTLKSFALGKYEVTQRQWLAVMGEIPGRRSQPTLPVVNVSWDDVQVFIRKLNAKTGKLYRLPTEAEWEYAARAGTTTDFSFGDDVSQLDRYAWFNENSKGGSHPVGEKAANGFGLHDMSGNVYEWAADCTIGHVANKMNYVGVPSDGSAATERRPCMRIIRGGDWRSLPYNLRSAFRGAAESNYRAPEVGFRLARMLP